MRDDATLSSLCFKKTKAKAPAVLEQLCSDHEHFLLFGVVPVALKKQPERRLSG